MTIFNEDSGPNLSCIRDNIHGDSASSTFSHACLFHFRGLCSTQTLSLKNVCIVNKPLIFLAFIFARLFRSDSVYSINSLN